MPLLRASYRGGSQRDPLGGPHVPQHPLGCARADEGARRLSNRVAKSVSVEGG
jgi:hypothetical protein